MYLQYADGDKNVYYVDLFEQKYTMLFLSLNWLFKRNIYLVEFPEDIISNVKNNNIKQFTIFIALGIGLSELIPSFNKKLYSISFHSSIIVFIILSIIIFFGWVFLLSRIRKKSLSKVCSIRKMNTKCKFKPKSTFSFLWIFFSIIIGRELLVLSFSLVNSASIDDLLLIIISILYVYMLPIISLLLCQLEYNGEKLNFIKIGTI